MMARRVLAGCAAIGAAAYLVFAQAAPARAYESTTGEALYQACGGGAPATNVDVYLAALGEGTLQRAFALAEDQIRIQREE